MPFYQRLNAKNPEDHRTLERLLALRSALDQEIPQRTHQDTLLIATWNIRDFDKPTFGYRMDESIYYIAEIIDRFDMVAVQEVYKDLTGLKRLLYVLGSHWKYLITDTAGGSEGNQERMAFLYDSRKVTFGGIAGEMVLPPIKMPDGTKAPANQIWRTPFICGFAAGWSRFMLSTVHIQWGGSQAAPKERVEEIRQVAQFLKERTEDKNAWSQNLILLGDFNIFNPKDPTFLELTKAGFEIPEQLQALPSNANRDRHYDQIAFRSREDRFALTDKAGIFDFYQHVYRLEDESTYIPYMMPEYMVTTDGKPRTESAKKNYFKTYWRTHQMSDHLPMWVELKINFSEEYLERKLEEASTGVSTRSLGGEVASRKPIPGDSFGGASVL